MGHSSISVAIRLSDMITVHVTNPLNGIYYAPAFV